MVSTEYPPIAGGIGRYTSNLRKALENLGTQVQIVSDTKGNGDFSGISPINEQNSEVLLEIVNKVQPDIVHIQFEPGLYGLTLNSSNPAKSRTNIDIFYRQCKAPIITTFHSVYTLNQWLNFPPLIKSHGRIGKIGTPARTAIRLWNRILSYKSLHNINGEKFRLSKAAIVFSNYASKLLGGGEVIYHGAEPAVGKIEKKEARSIFSLPAKGRIALALGFKTAAKGWDVLERMRLPDGWTMVVNSSRGYYNKELYATTWKKSTNIIDLKRNYLTDQELSILFFASDSVILPYKIISGSGVMFDALAHGLPFIATNLEFFQEFSSLNLGISVKRKPAKFYKALQDLDKKYNIYVKAVSEFKDKLRWDFVARQHLKIYNNAIYK